MNKEMTYAQESQILKLGEVYVFTQASSTVQKKLVLDPYEALTILYQDIIMSLKYLLFKAQYASTAQHQVII
jgi:hypothetical protein